MLYPASIISWEMQQSLINESCYTLYSPSSSIESLVLGLQPIHKFTENGYLYPRDVYYVLFYTTCYFLVTYTW